MTIGAGTGVPGETVGVIGLGAMGSLIARSLHDHGYAVRAFDVSPEARDRVADAGVTTADSVAEVGRVCDVVLLSLPTPAVVESVVAELAEATATSLVLDTSTVGPATSIGCRETLTRAGGDYADTPILGRPAAVGRWTVPVGGSAEVVEAASRVLAPVAQRVVGVGSTGSAATLKVLNNLMLGTINAITAEVLVLASASGLDPGLFVDTVVESGAASVSGLFKDIGPRAVAGDFSPTFSLALMRKDNGLALELADELGVPMPVGSAVQTTNTMAVASGLGDQDSIAIVRMLERLTGHAIERRPPHEEA